MLDDARIHNQRTKGRWGVQPTGPERGLPEGLGLPEGPSRPEVLGSQADSIRVDGECPQGLPFMPALRPMEPERRAKRRYVVRLSARGSQGHP